MATMTEIATAIRQAGMAAEQKGTLTPTQETLKGGLADGVPSSEFDPEQLKLGIQIEREHTTDAAVAEEIAKDHLKEDPQYYQKLLKMEKEKGVDKAMFSRFAAVSLTDKSQKSAGHLAFIGGYEFFQFNGRVYKAPIEMPIAVTPPRVRHGRDEGSINSWQEIEKRQREIWRK